MHVTYLDDMFEDWILNYNLINCLLKYEHLEFGYHDEDTIHLLISICLLFHSKIDEIKSEFLGQETFLIRILNQRVTELLN